MKIEINNRTKALIDLKLVKRVAAEFASAHKIANQRELSIAFISDAEIKKLNKNYRELNQPTDILSFGPGSDEEKDFFGELILDYAQIKRQAKEEGVSAKHELAFILTHGLFHLLGYSDETEKKRLKMIKLGEEFMKKLKL